LNTNPCIAKLSLALACLLTFSNFTFPQQPVKLFTSTSFTEAEYDQFQQTFGQHKTIPLQFRRQILIALSYYPGLKNISVDFRTRHARTPLKTVPAVVSIFKKSQARKYIITISDSTMGMLTPILLKNLNFNAQVGVLGHELSHVADFDNKNTLGLLATGIKHLSSKWIDRFEYRTDSICIAHGLGYQLLDWSMSVRRAMKSANYDGADNVEKPMMRERYMNPATIMKKIALNPLYKQRVSYR